MKILKYFTLALSLAIIFSACKKDNDEINKLNEFCRYENISIDYYLVEKKFQKIKKRGSISKSQFFSFWSYVEK